MKRVLSSGSTQRESSGCGLSGLQPFELDPNGEYFNVPDVFPDIKDNQYMTSDPGTDGVERAARWLASISQDRQPHPVIPFIRKTFALTVAQAVQAIRDANALRGGAE